MQTTRISVTEVIEFDSCRRSWLWSWVYGWRSKQPPLELWLGQGVHEGLDAYYFNDRSLQSSLDAYDGWFYRFREEQRQIDGFAWEGVESTFAEMAQMGRDMLVNYSLWDQQDSTLYGDVLGVELTLQALIRPSGREKIFPTLRGRTDLVLRRSDGIWIVDHKTSKNRSSWSGLDVDDQMTAYMYLFWRATGILPTGMIWNGLLKRLPEEPRRLKSGSLSQDKSQAVTYDSYLEQIEAIGDDPKNYTEMLSHLAAKGWSDFFAREGGSRNDAELIAYGRRTYAKYRDMLLARQYPDNYAYPSPSVYKCGYCQFQAPCKSKDDGGDYEAQLDAMFYKPAER